MSKSKLRTQEAQESYLISLALEEVEKRLINGTATSQLLSQLLSLSTAKYRLQSEKIRSDIELQKAKTDDLRERANMSEMFESAMKAFTIYRGEYDSDYNDGAEQ